jgi:hypothetical protein
VAANVCVVGMLVFIFVTGMSVGVFFVPSAIALALYAVPHSATA